MHPFCASARSTAVTILSLLSLVLRLVTAVPTLTRQSVCNGHAELCNRSYGNVTFVGAHDSFAFSTDPLALAADQHVDVPTQLSLGVRLLQAQAHLNDGVIHFCHTSCLLFDGGTVEAYLTNVKTFLDANPTEVITLLFTNPEGLSLPDVWAPAFEASGVAPLAYVPPVAAGVSPNASAPNAIAQNPVKQSDWPTLGELIEMGTRVLVFLDAGADGTDGSVDYIMPEFPMIWETPFSNTNASLPCSVDRIAGPLATEDHMYLINHVLDVEIFSTGIVISDPEQAGTTNDVASIMTESEQCTQFAAGRAPNFVLLDFVDEGQAFQAADILNGFAPFPA